MILAWGYLLCDILVFGYRMWSDSVCMCVSPVSVHVVLGFIYLHKYARLSPFFPEALAWASVDKDQLSCSLSVWRWLKVVGKEESKTDGRIEGWVHNTGHCSKAVECKRIVSQNFLGQVEMASYEGYRCFTPIPSHSCITKWSCPANGKICTARFLCVCYSCVICKLKWLHNCNVMY